MIQFVFEKMYFSMLKKLSFQFYEDYFESVMDV